MPPAPAAPAQRPLSEAIFVLYADPKNGKTAAFLRAFPRALIVGRRDAVQPVAESVCGFSPEPWQYVEGVTTLPHLVWWLSDTTSGLASPAWRAAIPKLGINAVIVDDLSQIASKSMILWDAEAGSNQHYSFKMLDRHLDHVSVLLADLGLMAGVSMHSIGPKFDQREKSPTKGQLLAMGAPEVPSSKQIQAVPSWATLVAPLRVGDSGDPWWGRVISVTGTDAGLWVSGDRNSVCWSDTPANLREVLRAARTPYNLTRLAGLEWQDDYAELVADLLSKGEPFADIAKDVVNRFGDYARPDTPGERHVQWALQDGIARHRIRAYRGQGILGALRSASAYTAPPSDSKSSG